MQKKIEVVNHSGEAWCVVRHVKYRRPEVKSQQSYEESNRQRYLKSLKRKYPDVKRIKIKCKQNRIIEVDKRRRIVKDEFFEAVEKIQKENKERSTQVVIKERKTKIQQKEPEQKKQLDNNMLKTVLDILEKRNERLKNLERMISKMEEHY